MNNQEKGLLYEQYVKDFIIQKLNKNAYLWNQCPENILIENDLVHSHSDMRLIRKDVKEGHLHSHKDIGIDIVQLDDDRCSIVQCKNGYSNGLCVDDIAGIMMRSAFIRDMNIFVYYTNCLSRNIRYTAKLSRYVVDIDCSRKNDELISVPDDSKIYFVKLPLEDMPRNIVKKSIEAYSYQTEAVAKFKEYFQANNRGILSLPCGCGKTYTSYLISNDYKHIVILSPLREFASQNLNRFIEYGYAKKHTLLVDTDGDRDVNSIKRFIEGSDRALISCTYKSMDLISECLDLFKDVLFIVDEFHNLTKANISDDDNHIFKLLNSDNKILFMSATPRIYDIEYEDDEYDVENLFGEKVYHMTFTDAIANKYITDYRIWLPSIHENNEELNKELSVYEIDNAMKNRCKFLYSCIANNGSRKCIVYCKDTEDMKLMMKSMETLNDFYYMGIDMYSISCGDSEKMRKDRLEKFASNNDKIQLLFNIRILNECIDIPSCDSIYISYPPKNKITTIQRISRATRVDKINHFKIANVYIWCDAYTEVLETLSSIKEYDIMFKDKIKVNAVNFYNSKEKKDIELVKEDNKMIQDCIIGIKEFKQYSWEDKLQMVDEYIKEYGKLPSQHDEIAMRAQIGRWINHQKINYKQQKDIMKQERIKLLWETFVEKHKILFRDNIEIWNDTLETVRKYIQDNGIRPSSTHQDEKVKAMGAWIRTQKSSHLNKKYIMENEEIRMIWDNFVKEFPMLFESEEYIWQEHLKQAEDFIQKNGKLPSYDTTTLGRWISSQKKHFTNNTGIMLNAEIKSMWQEFITRHYNLFQSSEESWKNNYEKIKEYIQQHNKLPSSSNKDKEIRSLGKFLDEQKVSYKEVEKRKNRLMNTNPEIKSLWESLIREHHHLFKSATEAWFDNLELAEKYISENKKTPALTDKNPDVKKLSKWLYHQNENYKNNSEALSQDNIRSAWEQFTSRHKYKMFMSNEQYWYMRLQQLVDYLETYNKLPVCKDPDENVDQIAVWLGVQKRNYKKIDDIMKQESIRNDWKKLVLDKYPHLF